MPAACPCDWSREKSCAAGRPSSPSNREKRASCSICRPTRAWRGGRRDHSRSGGLPRPGPEPSGSAQPPLRAGARFVLSTFPCIRPLRRLAPEGVAVVHVMKYLGNDAVHPAQGPEAELESFLDELQPGWRECILARRFLPGMTSHTAYRVPARMVCPAGPRSLCPNAPMFSWRATGSGRKECWRMPPPPAQSKPHGVYSRPWLAQPRLQRSSIHVES